MAAGLFAANPDAVARQRAADPALAHDNPLEEVFTEQLTCADLVILNKTDLIGLEDLSALCRDIEGQLRPGVKLISARDGRVPLQVALGLTAAAEDDLASRPSVHELEDGHDHDDFESFVITAGPVEDGNAFLGRLRAAIVLHDVLRVKGFIDRPGRDRRQVVQAVGDRLQHHFDRPWRAGEKRGTRLIVIGRKGLDRAAITAALSG
jgi:cobalamin biosynthesis protein CobW